MLSRVAEHIYWMARYIERAENTARLIQVNSHLLLDLPRQITFGWQPLVDITGNTALFLERHGEFSERNAVRFLVADEANPGSIFSSLKGVRENARTIRESLPREAWELINELYARARADAAAGLARTGRYDYLRGVIAGAQQMTGLLGGSMSHDAGYDFLRIGRVLERADMTTRFIDVRSANLLAAQVDSLAPFETIQWMGVLKSLSAYQMYRREVRGPVRHADVLRFLFQSERFPRSLLHCLNSLAGALHRLPRNQVPLAPVVKLCRMVSEADLETLVRAALHQFIDEIQLELGAVHDAIAQTYFALGLPAQEATQTQAQDT